MDDNANADGGTPPERSKSKPKPFLSANHERMLFEESGIEPTVVEARGYRTVETKSELRRLGFAAAQCNTPGLLIPIYSPTGEVVNYQFRPDRPRIRDGKPVKYETPKGSRMTLDVHPAVREMLADPSVPLWITEGLKKGDALASRGLCAVALQGVDCWQRGGVPLPEWEDVKLYGRLVAVVFDSDVSVKPEVQRALEGLVGFLKGRGARVNVVYLPDGPGGEKQGIDDYLLAGGTIEGLKAYAHEGIREDLSEVGRSLADVEPEQVEWLWERRIPKGKITVIDGDPDNGKSVLTTDLAARVTSGLDLPDGTPTETAGTVIVSAEDGASDTIRPRFDAAGGEPNRALLLGDDEPFAIPGDIPRLERAVKQVSAALVVIDPIMAFFSGNVNS